MWNATAETKINKGPNAKSEEIENQGKIDLIEPTTGKVYFEQKNELKFCQPRLMSLKSQALERLEEIQRDTAKELLKKRTTHCTQNKTVEEKT